ncbi:hypothetical protein, partial [Microvirga lotononidis]|uniref:hypothetical protein n=1 Tax=Microvirga lotononidis TaxID=864069 RepID=UPI0018A81EA0
MSSQALQYTFQLLDKNTACIAEVEKQFLHQKSLSIQRGNVGVFNMSYSATAWKPDIYESDSFSLDGYNWRVAGDEAHSFKSDGSVYRFEVRKGDLFSASYWTDAAGVERSEMGETSNHKLTGEGSHFHATYKMMIEPGAK